MARKRKIILAAAFILILVSVVSFYSHYCTPTRILIVNPLPAQAAEIVLNNDNSHIEVTCKAMDEARDFDSYDAVLMYGRGLYLDSAQMISVDKAAKKGVPIFTNTLRNFSSIVNHNLDSVQVENIQAYFKNPCQANYRNLLRYTRSIATPYKWGDMSYAEAVMLPNNMYYHLDGGKYFKKADELTEYLKETGRYNNAGDNIVFVSGITFPVEGNRAHIDSLISRLTQEGYNVYPLSATGRSRAKMIREVSPKAIVYLPMGRLGNDTLINWAYDNRVPLFMPFPLIQSREEWLDVNNPMSAGTLNARIVVPEIDGAMTPLCISTQDANADGYLLYNPVGERVDAFIEQFTRFMNLRTKPNGQKRVAIGYFKSPGKDALLASGMEVVPSLYNFLKRLRDEGYDVSGLPASVDAFKKQIVEQGSVMGSYAPAAQQTFMDRYAKTWINKDTYEKWATDVLLPEKYQEVTQRYGDAPGSILSRGDSLAIACVRYGNILLFPQPRPAVGDDDFKLVHGVEVAPPHSYLAPYLYMQKAFDADALIHFGTHGNLEFTPGKNAGLSQGDWAEVLTGNRPHFYFYTTGNVGEAIIAKRRSHAVIVTHLTPPYVESGLRQKYATLIEDIHDAIATPSKNTSKLKAQIVAMGVHKDLGMDSVSGKPYTSDELRKVDAFIEELANEKITGAYYTMGQPYDNKDMRTTVVAISADKLAYARAKEDRDKGKITTDRLQDYTFISHNYLPKARRDVEAVDLTSDTMSAEVELKNAVRYRELLTESPRREFDAMLGALSGVPVRPAPGGDPVLNPNVLPTGRNMYSINAEATPGEKAWNDGVSLAENTLKSYLAKHGEYPKKVSYTFWAGEFISSQGATIAQALRMLGVEPVRDEQGRVMDLRLIPSEELGRPRINILVQVSGQLRDIAGSRLKMLTEAVALASQAKDDFYPNYVAEGSIEQEADMVEKGLSPKRARELSTMRVFGPVNSGYSTGMLRYTESSGEWDDHRELIDGYLNNMCAMYGDDDNWGKADSGLLSAAIKNTDVIVQPRQSNTWGPISLDHVYEFTGALSLASAGINGKEPEAMMADYRNAYLPRMQDTKEAIAVETRATILNPEFIRERMKGDATTAHMFGEIFRNIFGWSVMRQSALNDDIHDDLYDLYVKDKENLGVEEYFNRVNPAALQEMTATMLESVRKGYWKASPEQLKATAGLHASLTERNGAPCTEFVCGNKKLQQFIAGSLDSRAAGVYREKINDAIAENSGAKVLKKENLSTDIMADKGSYSAWLIVILAIFAIVLTGTVIYRKRKQ
ncbi:MAG: cobaltochelatase subunit CobN [Bacteroides sp.]|nr:cobaltochelatase subunit CobN [Bacteroides sp.]